MLLDTLIIGLALWTLANLLVNEEGPYMMLDRFRHWAGVRRSEDLDLNTDSGRMAQAAIVDRKHLYAIDFADDNQPIYELPEYYGLNEVAWALLCTWCTSMDLALLIFPAYAASYAFGLQHILVIAMLPFAWRSVALIVEARVTD